MPAYIIAGLENQSFFDSYWVAVHFASGLIIGIGIHYWCGKKRWTVTPRLYWRSGFSLIILWEYFELILRFMQTFTDHAKYVAAAIVPDILFAPESLVNIASDLIVGAAGLLLVYLWRRNDRQS